MLRIIGSRSRQHLRLSSVLKPSFSPRSDLSKEETPSQHHPSLVVSATTNPQLFSTYSLNHNGHPWNDGGRRTFLGGWFQGKQGDDDKGISDSVTTIDNDSTNNAEDSSSAIPGAETTPAMAGETSSVETTDASVEETLDRLFAETQEETAADASDVVQQVIFEPTWYNLADQAIVAVKSIHDLSGFEYGWCIIAATALLRLGLFPVMIISQRHSSRMAHVQPELKQLQARYEALGTKTRQEQMQFTNNVKQLFQRYEAKPMRAFLGPLIQLPLFVGMFFGLRKICSIYPEDMANGGMLWFPDLSQPDPFYVLPLASGLSFVALTELTKDQMAQSGATGQFTVNFMRFMSIAMIPVLINFDSAMLCYWTTNNILTVGQTGLLQTKAVRDYFGIWDKPKPVPGTETPSLMKQLQQISKRLKGEPTTEKAKMEQHNRAIETKKKAMEMMRQNRK